MPTITAIVQTSSRDRCGVSSGSDCAAANDTTPRMPAHETAATPFQPTGSRERPNRDTRWISTNHTGRLTITVATTAVMATNTLSCAGSSDPTIDRSCSPISANTAPSSTNRRVAQVAVSVNRTDACTSVGER